MGSTLEAGRFRAVRMKIQIYEQARNKKARNLRMFFSRSVQGTQLPLSLQETALPSSLIPFMHQQLSDTITLSGPLMLSSFLGS
jgi:hypothetical protein